MFLNLVESDSEDDDREEEEEEEEEQQLDEDDNHEDLVDRMGFEAVIEEPEISGDEELDPSQTELEVRSFHLLRTSASLIKNEFTIL